MTNNKEVNMSYYPKGDAFYAKSAAFWAAREGRGAPNYLRKDVCEDKRTCFNPRMGPGRDTVNGTAAGTIVMRTSPTALKNGAKLPDDPNSK
jgi:hypothetical protein